MSAVGFGEGLGGLVALLWVAALMSRPDEAAFSRIFQGGLELPTLNDLPPPPPPFPTPGKTAPHPPLGNRTTTVHAHLQAQKLHCKNDRIQHKMHSKGFKDLLLDRLGVKVLGPAPLHLELLHMLTTFHWNALGRTLGWWFCLLRGRFRTARAQRAHSANYYGDYPGNNPENHPPAESCTINSNLKNSNI